MAVTAATRPAVRIRAFLAQSLQYQVHSHSSTKSPSTHSAPSHSHDSHGHIARSEKAKEDFIRQSGHPHGWPGHVVDHRVPLAEGGADDPSNMQWQMVEEAKAKDKVECEGRSAGGNGSAKVCWTSYSTIP